jgi:hypothetical protein
MDQEQWDIHNVQQLQRQHAKPDHVQNVLFSLPQMVPKKSTGTKINETYEIYVAKLNSPRCEKQIIWKVARAVCEHRIEESRIAAIFPRLEVASNRGAYFVACAKAAFKAVNLSWFEEDWEND